ncbi:MAG: hypothetical protein QOH24_2415 [Verrucomicrobiota bacterium]|jgi:opacity protein-like surface antigen
MKLRFAFFVLAVTASVQFAVAGDEAANTPGVLSEQPPAFQLAVESAYLLGIFNPPHSYELNADFLTARLRWRNNLDSTGVFRGYNQLYFSAIAEPIIRGIENHYFGINVGLRYNFVPRGSRLNPYISGGLGLGWIDSQPAQFGGQGQDFTFNILAATGVSYKFSERLSGQVGLLYQHLSNGGQTDPNPSLNLLGPQIGFTFSF